MVEYFKHVCPIITKKDEPRKDMSKSARVCVELVESQPGAQYAEGSWWQVFTAATYHIDYHLGRTADNRLASAWFGAGRQKKVDAMKAALEFAEAT